MSDLKEINPQKWTVELQSLYNSYMIAFDREKLAWYDEAWGGQFETFDRFLSFTWQAIPVTDELTGKGHIVTRTTAHDAFVKKVKFRFGVDLADFSAYFNPTNYLITPFERSRSHWQPVKISDFASYQQLHASLPTVVLDAKKARIRSGDIRAVRDLWAARDSTFLAIDFEWDERNNEIYEWGFASVRCGHLGRLNIWPPKPEENYTRGHYIVEEHSDEWVHATKHCTSQPWAYAFGESKVIPKTALRRIIKSVISRYASPDSVSTPNTLVLVGWHMGLDLNRLNDLGISLPSNVLCLDAAGFERNLYKSGAHGRQTNPSTGKVRATHSILSLKNVLASLGLEGVCAWHNAGNDAMMTLFVLQKLLAPEGTKKVLGSPHMFGLNQELGKRWVEGPRVEYAVSAFM